MSPRGIGVRAAGLVHIRMLRLTRLADPHRAHHGRNAMRRSGGNLATSGATSGATSPGRRNRVPSLTKIKDKASAVRNAKADVIGVSGCCKPASCVAV